MRCVRKLEADIGQDCIGVNVYLPDNSVLLSKKCAVQLEEAS